MIEEKRRKEEGEKRMEKGLKEEGEEVEGRMEEFRLQRGCSEM